jgi:hypothetical protein
MTLSASVSGPVVYLAKGLAMRSRILWMRGARLHSSIRAGTTNQELTMRTHLDHGTVSDETESC